MKNQQNSDDDDDDDDDDDSEKERVKATFLTGRGIVVSVEF
jgi:hypothetical protein